MKNVDVPALGGTGLSRENAGELGSNAQALSGMGSSLKQFLANLPAGAQLDSRRVESLLVHAWPGLKGAGEADRAAWLVLAVMEHLPAKGCQKEDAAAGPEVVMH